MQHCKHYLSKRCGHLRGRVLRERLDIGLEAVHCVRVLPVELRAQRRVGFFCTHRNQKTRVSDSLSQLCKFIISIYLLFHIGDDKLKTYKRKRIEDAELLNH